MNFESLEQTVTNKLQYFENNIKLIDSCIGSYDTLTALIQEENAKVTGIDFKITLYSNCINFLQNMHDMVQKQLHKVEFICTQAIQNVLCSPEIIFKILSEKKRNSVDTSFVVVDNKVGQIDLMYGEAGGTKNVVSVCLRLIFAELCNPRVDGPIVLDEAGVNISSDYQSNFGKFLKNFSESTGRQIILVSHYRPVISEAVTVIPLHRPGEPVNQEINNETT